MNPSKTLFFFTRVQEAGFFSSWFGNGIDLACWTSGFAVDVFG
jgi:hypothetical protein